MKKSGFFLSGKEEKYGCRAGSQEGKKPGKNAKEMQKGKVLSELQ